MPEDEDELIEIKEAGEVAKSTAIYVSQHYFDELYQHLKENQDKRHQEIMVIIDANLEKCRDFMRFGDREFPSLRNDAAKAVAFNRRAHHLL